MCQNLIRAKSFEGGGWRNAVERLKERHGNVVSCFLDKDLFRGRWWEAFRYDILVSLHQFTFMVFQNAEATIEGGFADGVQSSAA